MTAAQPHTEAIWKILEQVPDPEVPVLTVLDLGVVRNVEWAAGDKLVITITPTYTGCPAMNVIEVNIRAALEEAGFYNVDIKTVLSPAWTTDWLTQEGRRKLKAYGIAPPLAQEADKNVLFAEARKVPCPHCDSENTKMVSQFGSTACKAHHQCLDCLEPFDYFKCH